MTSPPSQQGSSLLDRISLKQCCELLFHFEIRSHSFASFLFKFIDHLLCFFFFLKLLAVQQGTGDLTSLTRDCCVARHGGSYFPHQGLLCSKARGILLPSPGIEPACLKVKVQSRPILCDPMDCSLPGSSVHGIFQAIVLEWIAISFSRGSSQPRD